MFLIDLLEENSLGMQSKQLHIHAYLCLCLRNAVSLFSHINISDEEVSRLEQHCCSFVRGYSPFFCVNPTVWILGHVVPLHTKEMKGKYGMGLGLNSMEGREAKHIAIILPTCTNGSKYFAMSIFLSFGSAKRGTILMLMFLVVNCVIFLSV